MKRLVALIFLLLIGTTAQESEHDLLHEQYDTILEDLESTIEYGNQLIELLSTIERSCIFLSKDF